VTCAAAWVAIPPTYQSIAYTLIAFERYEHQPPRLAIINHLDPARGNPER